MAAKRKEEAKSKLVTAFIYLKVNIKSKK